MDQGYIWTPQDMSRLAAMPLTKGAYRAYGVALKFADRKTGCFGLSKAQAAAHMRCSKRCVDESFALLVRLGVIVREEIVRGGRQRRNTWRLVAARYWVIAAVSARVALKAIMEKLKARRARKAARLQLLFDAKSSGPLPQNDLLEECVRQEVAKRALREGYGSDYGRQEDEVRSRFVGGVWQ